MKKEIKKRKSNATNKSHSDKKIHSWNLFFVNLQVVLTILTIILFIVSIFNRSVLTILQLSLGIDLLVMAYNNQVIYQRKRITILYVIVGVVLLILAALVLIGV